ncbi:hypothetical protein NE237_021038 [Protea cynaroides]|uniref:Uncharacterized protein n=1 Tax=Protea cynaroides TaxID=273540 RepID=A0A9Q0K4H7_9MAGN|nr:hypothetical protein NE237_021038 [Protea cynaroides]
MKPYVVQSVMDLKLAFFMELCSTQSIAAFGGVIKNYQGQVLMVLAEFMGAGMNFIAELQGNQQSSVQISSSFSFKSLSSSNNSLSSSSSTNENDEEGAAAAVLTIEAEEANTNQMMDKASNAAQSAKESCQEAGTQMKAKAQGAMDSAKDAMGMKK